MIWILLFYVCKTSLIIADNTKVCYTKKYTHNLSLFECNTVIISTENSKQMAFQALNGLCMSTIN